MSESLDPEGAKPIFRNATLVGDLVDPATYQDQGSAVRGDREYRMSRSELMDFVSCPARWKIRPDEKESTKAVAFGSAFDCATLDPKRFDRDFVLTPDTQPASKSMKAVRDGLAEVGDPVPWSPTSSYAQEWKETQESSGRTVVTSDMRVDLEAAGVRLSADARIATLIACSRKQVMIRAEYFDEEHQLSVPIKALIDLVPHVDHPAYGRWLADLKTARSAGHKAWTRAVDDQNYDAQAALYLDLYKLATGEDRNTFAHAIVENVAPFQTARRILSQEFIEMGRRKIIGALRFYARCLAQGKWPDWDENSQFDGWGLCDVELWMITRQ